MRHKWIAKLSRISRESMKETVLTAAIPMRHCPGRYIFRSRPVVSRFELEGRFHQSSLGEDFEAAARIFGGAQRSLDEPASNGNYRNYQHKED